MRTRSLIPAALLLFGCSLHHAAVGPAPARGPARDSLYQLDQSRGDSIAARGPVEGVLTLLDPDVVYLRSGTPATYGRDGARALLTATASAPAPGANPIASWQPMGGGVSNDLRSAYSFGVAARLSQARSTIRFERYIAFWKRAADQSWKIAAYAEIGAASASNASDGRGGGDEATLPPEFTTPPPRQLPSSIESANAELRAADSSFSDLAYRKGVGFAVANTAAPDAVLFNGPQLIVGSNAMQDFYDSQREGSSLTWHPVYWSVAGSGDLGFTVGEYVATGRGPSGAAVQRFGKYLTVWRRQPDGTWKFVVNGGNSTK
jgi:ketosteroid isomerase-like protein